MATKTKSIEALVKAENARLRSLVEKLTRPTPTPGWLALPIPDRQHATVMEWLRNNFSCDYHGEGYFEGTRFCVFEPRNFPLPFGTTPFLMVEFSNTDEAGSLAHAAWFAVKE